MNTIKQGHTFTVEGRGEFPEDMLRYDECAPLNYADTRAMKQRGLRMVTLTGRKHTPTFARWESFGWKVVAVGNRLITKATGNAAHPEAKEGKA